MKMKNLPVLAALIVLLVSTKPDTTLELKVIDSVSKSWVWNAEIKIDGKFTRAFYQSDTGTRTYTFTRLEPGKYVLAVQAPDYTGITLPVTIYGGRNLLSSPIELTGYRIPNIKEFFVYKDRDQDSLILNPRPLDSAGQGIGTHPCLDMWFWLRISVQVKNGVFVREPVETGSERGEALFEGKLDWTWDSYPDAFYRYNVRLPKSAVKRHNAPYNVYDYIIVLPDPRKISKSEINEVMAEVMLTADFAQATATLDRFGDRLNYFISSDWNQPAL
jgi:hypothetical protein